MTLGAPLISIVMPVYNGAEYLCETMYSVLNQTCRDFEFIIVNDGSTDSTRQIIESYHDPRIIPVNLDENRGVSNARNLGVDSARGAYLAFCDADDLYDPARLQAQLDFLAGNPAVDVCGSYFYVLEDGRKTLVEHPLADTEIKERFFTGNCLGQPSIMGKSRVFREYKYNPELKASEDYDLWARMALGGVVFANVPRPLVKYRLHPAQASKTRAKLLHDTSNRICTDYALAFLDSRELSGFVRDETAKLTDFKRFITELASACGKKSRDMNTFRPLIALQYKKLYHPGIFAYLTLRSIASRYGLNFPANYLLNIFLLSILPVNRNSSFFNTLTKLKL